jgi:hypothetical protein
MCKFTPLTLLFLGICTLGALAQDDDGGAVIIVGNPGSGGNDVVQGPSGSGNLTIGTGGSFGNLGSENLPDVLAILPQIPLSSLGSISSWTVTPGSTITLSLELLGGGNAAAVNGFLADITSEPYFTLTTITPELPSGFSDSYDNGTFSAENDTGTDISSAATVDNGSKSYSVTPLALLTFTIDADAPIGTKLVVPTLATGSTLLDDSGNTITTDTLTTLGPTVVVPEPSLAWLLALGCGGLGALIGVRRLRSVS